MLYSGDDVQGDDVTSGSLDEEDDQDEEEHPGGGHPLASVIDQGRAVSAAHFVWI